MNSGLFRLNWADLGKGLLVAVGTAVVLYAQGLLGQTDFTFASIPWPIVLNVSISAALGYLLKNLATSNQGNVLGIGDYKGGNTN